MVKIKETVNSNRKILKDRRENKNTSVPVRIKAGRSDRDLGDMKRPVWTYRDHANEMGMQCSCLFSGFIDIQLTYIMYV